MVKLIADFIQKAVELGVLVLGVVVFVESASAEGLTEIVSGLSIGGLLVAAIIARWSRSVASALRSLLFGLLIILVPPVAVALRRGGGVDLFLNLMLTLLGYVPGLIHALILLIPTTTETPNSPLNSDTNEGFVYVLRHPNMPELVKIGYTTRSPSIRAKELSKGTGVPGEYEVAHAVEVEQPKRIEQQVHAKLSGYRVSEGEFFRVQPKEALKAIRELK